MAVTPAPRLSGGTVPLSFSGTRTPYTRDGAYGAEEAAKRYFGKSASELSLSEAAALAGFLHAPSTYLSEDGEGSEFATERRDEILERMAEQDMISDEELNEAKAVSLEFAPDPPSEEPAYAPFEEAVRREVEEKLGPEALEHGGLEIHTTLADEIKAAFASPPLPESAASPPLWGEFVDAALAAELEMVPYGERPVLLGELRAGLGKAVDEAGIGTALGNWFAARRDALPGEDLPENLEYLPV